MSWVGLLCKGIKAGGGVFREGRGLWRPKGSFDTDILPIDNATYLRLMSWIGGQTAAFSSVHLPKRLPGVGLKKYLKGSK